MADKISSRSICIHLVAANLAPIADRVSDEEIDDANEFLGKVG